MLDSQKQYIAELAKSKKTIRKEIFAFKVLNRFRELKGLKSQKIGLREAEAFHAYLKTNNYTGKTVNTIVSCLRKYYAYLLKAKLATANPFLKLKWIPRSQQLKQEIELLSVQKNYLAELGKVKKSLANEGFSMKHFAKYLKSTGLDLYNLSLFQARHFISSLQELKDGYGKTRYAVTTINHVLKSLRSFYKYLVNKGLCGNNPFLKLKSSPEKESQGKKPEQKIYPVQEEYLKQLQAEGKSLSAPTNAMRVFYAYVVENNLNLYSLRIKEAAGFQSYLLSMLDESGAIKYKKTSAGKIMSAVRVFYAYLKKMRLLMSNPFLELKNLAKEQSLPRNIPTEEEMVMVLDSLRGFCAEKSLAARKQTYRLHVAAELMYSTGLSITEVMQLKTGDIDFEEGVVRVNQGQGSREALLNEYAREVLKLYLGKMRKYILSSGVELLFASKTDLVFGSRTNLKNLLNKKLAKICKKLGLKVMTTTDIRYATGYHLLRAGCGIRHLQGILGHKRLKTTQKYMQLDKEDLKKLLDKFHPRAFKQGGAK